MSASTLQVRLADAGHPVGAPLSIARQRSFWPTPTHEALLRAALVGPPHLVSALERWQATAREPLDHASLTLLPLLYRNLERHRVAPEVRQRLGGFYRWSWHRNQLLLAALERALGVLREADVPAVLMKGVPLALRVYRDVGARVMGDADLVVRRGDIDQALDALAGVGWKPERPVTADLIASLGGVNLHDADGRSIDLHWHVLPDAYDAALDEELLRCAEPVRVGGEAASCLNPADHLLLVISHGLSWAANAPLHWVADAVLLLRREGASVDWDRLVEQAKQSRRVHTVRSGLRYLRERFDAPVPSAAAKRLDAAPTGLGERAGLWFAERSDGAWPWGRAPLVAASYLRASRASGRRPTLAGLTRFLSVRADCPPREWLRRAAVGEWRQLRRLFGARS